MWQLLNSLKSRLSFVIPAAMAAGFIFGLVFGNPKILKAWILPLTILMILPMMVTFPVSRLFSSGLKSKLLGVNLGLNFVLIPLIAWGLARIFYASEPGFALGMVIIGLIPTSGMTISWTGFAKGNVKAAVGLMVIGLLAGAVAAPVLLDFLMGSRIQISLLGIFRQILLIVFIPMLAGMLIRQGLIKYDGRERFEQFWKRNIPSVSSLGVVLVVFIATALKARALAANPEQILFLLLPVVLFYAVLYVVITLIGRSSFTREDGLALVFSTVMRNLSLALAIAVNSFPQIGSQAALVIALAYVVQVQSASLYVKYGRRSAFEGAAA